MKQTTLKINGQDLILKQSFRALIAFEAQTGKNAFNVNTSITDGIIMFYCMLQAANETFKMTFDDFLSYLDTDPNAVPKYYSYLASIAEKTEKAMPNKKKAETRGKG